MWTTLKHWLANRLHLKHEAMEAMPSDETVSSALAGAMLKDLIRERRSERRWRFWKRVALSVVFVGGVLVYVQFYLAASGVSLFERAPEPGSIGVIRIHGAIGAERPASAANLLPALRKAFETQSIHSVVLQIDSPGGAPVEAERISTYLRTLKTAHPKPLYAVIENVGASAAYMIAVEADEIIAGRYSLVGSVGAMMASWDAHRAIERASVERRVFASGDLKAMLDPFLPASEAELDKAQSLVNEVGSMFVDDVRRARADKLDPALALERGEVFSGAQALELGLIDQLGTLESLQHRLGDAPLKRLEPPSPLRKLTDVFAEFQASLLGNLVDLAHERQLRIY